MQFELIQPTEALRSYIILTPAVLLKNPCLIGAGLYAWFFATALAKQWEATLPYIQQRRLNSVTHRMTIQKAVESFRITLEQKELLKTFRLSQN